MCAIRYADSVAGRRVVGQRVRSFTARHVGSQAEVLAWLFGRQHAEDAQECTVGQRQSGR